MEVSVVKCSLSCATVFMENVSYYPELYLTADILQWRQTVSDLRQ
jgi:hypothetical protein